MTKHITKAANGRNRPCYFLRKYVSEAFKEKHANRFGQRASLSAIRELLEPSRIRKILPLTPEQIALD